MATQKRKLVPIASLKFDLPVDNVEEPAPTKAKRIAPFQDSPLTFFEDVFDQAHHICGGESTGEHFFDGISSDNRGFSYLMINGLFGIETRESVDICAVAAVVSERIEKSKMARR